MSAVRMRWLLREAIRGDDRAVRELLWRMIPTGLGVLFCWMAGQVYAEGHTVGCWVILGCGTVLLVQERFL